MSRGRYVVITGAVAAAAVSAVAVAMYVPLFDPPPDVFTRVDDVEIGFPQGPRGPVASEGGAAVVASLRACMPVGIVARMSDCWPPFGVPTTGHVEWKSHWEYGYRTVVVLFHADSALMIVQPANGWGGRCDGRYVLTCPPETAAVLRQIPIVPEAAPVLPPAPVVEEIDVATMRSHADMLTRIVAGQPGDPASLADLDALVSAGGKTVFIVAAAGDEVGWRVEGSTDDFKAAVLAIAERRVGHDRASKIKGLMRAPPYAIEVVDGAAGWVRVDAASTIMGARAALGGITPRRELEQVLGKTDGAFEVWTGVWESTDGRTGFSVATRRRPGEVSVIVDGNIVADPYAKEERDIEKARWSPGGDALACVEQLTKGGNVGHGARLGKVFAELGAEDCVAILERGYPAWWGVEIAPK